MVVSTVVRFVVEDRTEWWLQRGCVVKTSNRVCRAKGLTGTLRSLREAEGRSEFEG